MKGNIIIPTTGQYHDIALPTKAFALIYMALYINDLMWDLVNLQKL